MEEIKPKDETASILEGNPCECGWPVIHACCNDEFVDFQDADCWSWWVYCTNKGCENHEGEGIHYSWPKWIVKV